MKNRILFPALLLGTILVTVSAKAEGSLFVKELYVPADELASRTPPPSNPSEMEAELTDWVMQSSNHQRALAGLPALAHDQALSDAAARYSRKMRDQRFFDHVSPDGETLSQRIPESDGWRYQKIGENLWSAEGALNWQAHLIADEAAANWIESPSHRDNLLEPAYTLGGVGTAIQGEKIYITMLYARPHDNLEQAAILRDHGKAPADLGGLAQLMQGAIVSAINRERIQIGLRALSDDVALGQAAQNHSQAMLSGGFLSATDQNGQSVLDQAIAADPHRVTRIAVGLWRGSGGLAWQPDAITGQVLNTWQQNASNWADVLDPRFDMTGIGVATDGSKVLVTALFAESAPFQTRVISPAGFSTIRNNSSAPQTGSSVIVVR